MVDNVSSLLISSILPIVWLNIFIIPETPPHFGRTFFDSPSNTSLINLSNEHSVLVKPLKIGLTLINPIIESARNTKFNTDTITKKGTLHFIVLQQLKHLQPQKAQQQKTNHPGIHKTPKIVNTIIGARCFAYFLLLSPESPSSERIFIRYIVVFEGSESS